MRPEARRRFFAAAFFSTLAIALAAGQEGGAFGLSAANLAKLLAGKDVAPALSIDDTALADTGSYGPAAYYYLGRWMESRYPGPLPRPGSRCEDGGPVSDRLRKDFRVIAQGGGARSDLEAVFQPTLAGALGLFQPIFERARSRMEGREGRASMHSRHWADTRS